MASLTLGELLKKKAEDGVRVLLMIWGETTSIMGTHDTETENFFKGGYQINDFMKNLIRRKNLKFVCQIFQAKFHGNFVNNLFHVIFMLQLATL